MAISKLFDVIFILIFLQLYSYSLELKKGKEVNIINEKHNCIFYKENQKQDILKNTKLTSEHDKMKYYVDIFSSKHQIT